MLAKNNNGGNHSMIIRLDDGRIMRFCPYRVKELAILTGDVRELCDSITELKKHWTILEPSLETMSIGDLVKNGHMIYRILTAQGVGGYRTYMLSYTGNHKSALAHSTAHELAEQGYTALPWEESEQEELTMEEVCEELGRTVKIKK